MSPQERSSKPPAVNDLMDRAGTNITDYDLVELNEAFASQTLYCQHELDIDDARFYVNGGAIALGHPLGASGARLPVISYSRNAAERGKTRALHDVYRLRTRHRTGVHLPLTLTETSSL